MKIAEREKSIKAPGKCIELTSKKSNMMNLRFSFLFAILLASCQNQPAPDAQSEAPVSGNTAETPATEQKPAAPDNSQMAEAASKAGAQIATESDMVGLSKGTIAGKNVPIRNAAGFKAEKGGSFNDKEVVQILSNKVIQTEGEGFLNKPVTLKKNGSSITLGKDKKVLIEGANEAANTFFISYEDPKKGRFEAEVNADVFQGRIFANWYLVKRENGETGWVMANFLKIN